MSTQFSLFFKVSSIKVTTGAKNGISKKLIPCKQDALCKMHSQKVDIFWKNDTYAKINSPCKSDAVLKYDLKTDSGSKTIRIEIDRV